MVNRNFENLLAVVLESSSVVYGHLPVLGVNGLEYFLTNNLNFPGSRAEGFTLDANAAGISLGTGTTPASKTDVNLENTITSGISVTMSSRVVGCENGEPYLEYTMTVTNTGTSPIVITEAAYKQTVKAASWVGSTSAADVVCLIDRTVFNSPVTIYGGDAGIVKYTLKTVPAPKTVNGIKIVSFTYGTDAEVAAMIDAARAGTIDLQTDGGWAVGDTRTIHLSAFTGGGSVAHAAQDIDIAISEFSNYMGSGSLFQFDFVEALATGQRMEASNTNKNGYGGSEMFLTTLPALVSALPSWLSSRLLTFDVLASSGNQLTTIDTVSGNKLALRSEIEIFGTTTYSVVGEGYQIQWYKAGGARTKRRGRTGSANDWWERSPNSANATHFCSVSNNGTARSDTAGTAHGLAPFGCI